MMPATVKDANVAVKQWVHLTCQAAVKPRRVGEKQFISERQRKAVRQSASERSRPSDGVREKPINGVQYKSQLAQTEQQSLQKFFNFCETFSRQRWREAGRHSADSVGEKQAGIQQSALWRSIFELEATTGALFLMWAATKHTLQHWKKGNIS